MLAGTQVGAYRVLQQIGAGGMGEVWLAEHTMLGRRAAIKVLHSEYSSRPEIVTRFFNEARAATTIADPGIVQIFDFGQHVDGSAYIVMELLEGEPLDKRLARCGSLAVPDALRILRQVATTLGAAHARGIVHRDLKPENIFLVRDAEVVGGERAKVLDFGIAKLAGTQSSVKTQTATVMGTPTYMSPEQCRGAGRVDARSDVYSLGCVLFTLLVGRPPFDSEGVGDIIAMHLREVAPRASTRMPTIPPVVDELIARCLEKDPALRFASGSELAVAIDQLLSRPTGQPFAAMPATVSLRHPAATGGADTTLSAATGASTQTHAPSRSRSGLIIGGIALAGVIGGVAIIATRQDSPSAQGPGSSSTASAPKPAAALVPDAAVTVVPAAPSPSQSAITAQRITAVLTSFVAWSKTHAGAPCPAPSDLDSVTQDGWGHELAITCTDQPSNQIIGVVAAGSDGVMNTVDDIASWQLGRDVTTIVHGARWVAAPPAPVRQSEAEAPAKHPAATPAGHAKPTPTKHTQPNDTAAEPAKPSLQFDENGLPISR